MKMKAKTISTMATAMILLASFIATVGIMTQQTRPPTTYRDITIDALDGSAGTTGSDIIVFHYCPGCDPTTAQTDAMKAVTAIPNSAKGAEFFSLAEIEEHAAFIKAQGLGFISYDLEAGASPSAEVSDPVASMVEAKNIVNGEGLAFMATPSKAISENFGADILEATGKIYRYHLQSQPLQGDDSTCTIMKDWITARVNELQAATTGMGGRISYQVTLTGEIAPGDPDQFTTAKRCMDAVSQGIVDGNSIWTNTANIDNGKYEELLTYYDDTYS
jgi:hypothetical protein